MNDPFFIIAVLSAAVAFSEWLANRTWLRHLGSALLVILVAAVAANSGLIPTYSGDQPVYDALLGPVGQLAIFWLLLRVNLREVLRAGGPMIGLFLTGSAGTMLGVAAGLALFGGAEAFGELHWALGGMFVGTYVGGSINFNAIALEYGVVRDGVLYTGAAAVDSAYTAVWMAATVALPKALARFWPAPASRRAAIPDSGLESADDETETVSARDGAALLALGALGVWGASAGHELLERALGWSVPTILLLTSAALALAQSGTVQRLRGIRTFGWLAVMVFLATIGTLCDLSSVRQLGPLGVRLVGFVGVLLVIHGTVVFAAARLLRLDPAVAAVASQANIGGSTSALALARSLARPELALPGVLVGALGNALGTYLGLWVAVFLRQG